MKARIAVVVVAAALVAAAPADADVTIGSALPAPAATTVPCLGGCTVALSTLPGPVVPTVAAPGVISRWRVRAGATVRPVRLQVIRPSGVTAVEVNHSATITPPTNQVTFFATRQPIAPGDLLAIEIPDGATPDYFAPTVGATADIWSGPALSTTARTPDIAAQPNTEVLINADVEADADTDGYGDETQDNCPAAANPTQADLDHDGQGDTCDLDDDGDGQPDGADACPRIPGPELGCPEMPPPPPNRAPTVRFRAPLAGSTIGPSFRVVLDVADDTGSPTVSVFDDDGTVCVLRRAPYACTWTPTGADVGRATLLASAVDSGGLSTLGIVRVRVRRFAASLTQRQRHRKGVTRVSGRLVLPAGVTRAQGCSGTVRIRLRKARRTATVTRRCTYSARLPFRPGRARVSFGGNSVLAPT